MSLFFDQQGNRSAISTSAESLQEGTPAGALENLWVATLRGPLAWGGLLGSLSRVYWEAPWEPWGTWELTSPELLGHPWGDQDPPRKEVFRQRPNAANP